VLAITSKATGPAEIASVFSSIIVGLPVTEYIILSPLYSGLTAINSFARRQYQNFLAHLRLVKSRR
jgi:hypothetical protein